ncbi:MAG: hypothetical protein Ct9H300mP3_04690 [Gammaproteobacteria bacterium]|nr:MAG: hypothetical protein Ct9H300mP3_04690 [Gammaproteobacteria bacterium]
MAKNMLKFLSKLRLLFTPEKSLFIGLLAYILLVDRLKK